MAFLLSCAESCGLRQECCFGRCFSCQIAHLAISRGRTRVHAIGICGSTKVRPVAERELDVLDAPDTNSRFGSVRSPSLFHSPLISPIVCGLEVVPGLVAIIVIAKTLRAAMDNMCCMDYGAPMYEGYQWFSHACTFYSHCNLPRTFCVCIRGIWTTPAMTEDFVGCLTRIQM